MVALPTGLYFICIFSLLSKFVFVNNLYYAKRIFFRHNIRLSGFFVLVINVRYYVIIYFSDSLGKRFVIFLCDDHD